MDLLEALRAGTCTTGDVAALAAEVISSPPPEIAAAQRFLASVGTAREGMAAAELLGLLVAHGDDREVSRQHG